MPIPSVTDIVVNLDDLTAIFGLNAALIGDVVVDVLTSYTPGRSADVSEHPVEAGLDIANARVIRPQTITMECILTDPDYSGANVAKAALSGSLGNLVTSWRDKRDRLEELFESNTLLNVSTYEKKYSNMVITGMIPDRRSATSGGYFVTVELREIRVVDSDFFTISQDDVPKEVEELASDEQKTVAEKIKPKKRNAGTVAASAASDNNDSILHSLVGGITGVESGT